MNRSNTVDCSKREISVAGWQIIFGCCSLERFLLVGSRVATPVSISSETPWPLWWPTYGDVETKMSKWYSLGSSISMLPIYRGSCWPLALCSVTVSSWIWLEFALDTPTTLWNLSIRPWPKFEGGVSNELCSPRNYCSGYVASTTMTNAGRTDLWSLDKGMVGPFLPLG